MRRENRINAYSPQNTYSSKLRMYAGIPGMKTEKQLREEFALDFPGEDFDEIEWF